MSNLNHTSYQARSITSHIVHMMTFAAFCSLCGSHPLLSLPYMIYVPFLHVFLQVACLACFSLAECTPKLSLLQHTLKLEERDAQDSISSLSGDSTSSLFVKFHKVAGSTWRAYIDLISHQDNSCSKDCGNPVWDCQQRYPHDAAKFEWCSQQPGKNKSCSGIAHSCTFHTGMAVMRQAVSGQNISTLTSDMADAQNLWPSSERLRLLSEALS